MPSPVAGSRVSGRLVGEEDQRAVDRPRHRLARCCTTGQLVGEALLLAGETDEVEHGETCWRMTCLGLPITSWAKATFSNTVRLGSSL